MSKKQSSSFICSSCGAQSQRWIGKCPQCGDWNTYNEQLGVSEIQKSVAKGHKLKIEDVSTAANQDHKRIKTLFAEIDDVLGGGIVPGSVILLAGQPGIGKSTLLLQIASAVAAEYEVLYVSGEESSHQIGMRAERLGTTSNKLHLATSNITDDIAATIASGQHELVVVDSIQTIVCNQVTSSAGSVAQISSSANMLIASAKSSNKALIIVGHVTKDGSIAGPKVLEHLVDVVLQFEGDNYGGFKILRASKNRYGSTSEVSILEMVEKGLQAVKNPSAALLAERQISDGSIVMATMEGSRAVLVEIQALVNKTSFGYPKRAAVGIEINRLNLLIAMLERRTKLNLSDKDVYINIIGGLKITEPAVDLAVCLAIASADRGMILKGNAVVFGEVGLSGEVRHVPYMEKRVLEAVKMGFEMVIGPRSTGQKIGNQLQSVADVRSALNSYLT